MDARPRYLRQLPERPRRLRRAQVSGKYAMLRAGADAEPFSWPDALWESLLAFKRAGADAIVTYAALAIAERLGTEQAASRS